MTTPSTDPIHWVALLMRTADGPRWKREIIGGRDYVVHASRPNVIAFIYYDVMPDDGQTTNPTGYYYVGGVEMPSGLQNADRDIQTATDEEEAGGTVYCVDGVTRPFQPGHDHTILVTQSRQLYVEYTLLGQAVDDPYVAKVDERDFRQHAEYAPSRAYRLRFSAEVHETIYLDGLAARDRTRTETDDVTYYIDGEVRIYGPDTIYEHSGVKFRLAEQFGRPYGYYVVCRDRARVHPFRVGPDRIVMTSTD